MDDANELYCCYYTIVFIDSGAWFGHCRPTTNNIWLKSRAYTIERQKSNCDQQSRSISSSSHQSGYIIMWGMR